MNVILWIVFGGVVGWVASIMTETDAEIGVGSNIIVGIIGALIGGWTVVLFGGPRINEFNFANFTASVLGAMVLLAVVKGFRRPLRR